LALLCRAKNGQNPGVKYWEIIADNLSKAGSIGAVYQRLIPTGKQPGLLTRTATTEKDLSFTSLILWVKCI
jgi:hypothetical protein